MVWDRQIFMHRQFVLFPFEASTALFALYTGITGMLGLGLTSDLFIRNIGTEWAFAFNLLYAFAGAAMYLGVVSMMRNIEAFGLVLMVTSVLIRLIALGWQGFPASDERWSIIHVQVMSALILMACAARLYLISRHRFIEELPPRPSANG